MGRLVHFLGLRDRLQDPRALQPHVTFGELRASEVTFPDS